MSAMQFNFRGLRFGRILVWPCGKRKIEFIWPSSKQDDQSIIVEFGNIGQWRLVQRQLRNAGYTGPVITRVDALTLDDLVMKYSKTATGKDATVNVQYGAGWNSKRTKFLIDHNEYPAGGKAVCRNTAGPQISTQRGTLAGWKASVGIQAAHSSRAMLLISAALAAPTLALMDISAGGFGLNIWGISSTGKSTALRAAASVLSGDYAGSWNGTSCGLQDLAQQYCDLPLTIDSLESAYGIGQKELAESVAYALGNGVARIRSENWTTKEPRKSGTWRTVLLSTAEAKQQRVQRTGAAVRLIDIPVNSDVNRATGIVDYLPPGLAENAKREFSASVVAKINRGIAKHHGHVLPAFVEALANDRAASSQKLAIERLNFLQKFDAQELSNSEVRMLDNFATAYSAGVACINLGLLPWRTPHLFDAVKRCAVDAFANSNDRTMQAKLNADRVLKWVTDPSRKTQDFLRQLSRSQIAAVDLLEAEVEAPEADDGDYKPSKLVLRDTLQKALRLSGKELTAAMLNLRNQGKLVTEGREDALTIQYKFRDCSVRFYVICV